MDWRSSKHTPHTPQNINRGGMPVLGGSVRGDNKLGKTSWETVTEFEQDMKKFGDSNYVTIRMSGGGNGTGAPRRVAYIFNCFNLGI